MGPKTVNDNEDTVTPLRNKNGEYTDFRVFLNDALRTGAATRRGIVIWIDDEDAMLPQYTGVRRQHLAMAAVHLMKDAGE